VYLYFYHAKVLHVIPQLKGLITLGYLHDKIEILSHTVFNGHISWFVFPTFPGHKVEPQTGLSFGWAWAFAGPSIALQICENRR
jgi:hypothetical protein